MPATATTRTATPSKTDSGKLARAPIESTSEEVPTAIIKFKGRDDFDIELIHGEGILASQVERLVSRLWTAIQEERRKVTQEAINKDRLEQEKLNG